MPSNSGKEMVCLNGLHLWIEIQVFSKFYLKRRLKYQFTKQRFQESTFKNGRSLLPPTKNVYFFKNQGYSLYPLPFLFLLPKQPRSYKAAIYFYFSICGILKKKTWPIRKVALNLAKQSFKRCSIHMWITLIWKITFIVKCLKRKLIW